MPPILRHHQRHHIYYLPSSPLFRLFTLHPSTRYAIFTFDESGVGPRDNVFDSNTIGSDYTFRFWESNGINFTNNEITIPGTADWTNSTHIVVTGNVGLDDVTITLGGYVCFDETDEESLDTATIC